MRREVWHGVLAAEKDAAQVDRDDAIPVGDGKLVRRGDDARDAGVVDQDIDGAAHPRRGVNHRLHLIRHRNVAGEEPGVATLVSEQLHGLRTQLGAQVGDEDHGSLLAEPKRDRPADASRRPRDDGHPTRQPPASMLHGRAPPAY